MNASGISRSPSFVFLLTQSIWKDLSEWKRSPDGMYTVRDCCCSEFEEVVKSVEGLSPQIQVQRMKALTAILNQNWRQKYKLFVTASYYDGSNSKELGLTVSSFGLSLLDLPWLPAVTLFNTPYTVPLLKGSELYQVSEGNRRLLHSHMPYIGAEVTDDEFLKHLGIRISVSAECLLGYLRQWAKSGEGGPFHTSVDHMRNVYLFLWRKSEEIFEREGSSFIRDAFREEELVFVPLSTIEKRQWQVADVNGHFLSVHKVCWWDKTSVLYRRQESGWEIPAHLPRVLSSYYMSRESSNQMREAFNHFGVSEDIKIQGLIDLLEYNASHSPTPDAAEVESFRSIAEAITAVINRPHPTVSSFPGMGEESEDMIDQALVNYFRHNVQELRVFPSQGKKWVLLKGLFLNDKGEIARQFADTEGIHFLQWPPKKGRRPEDELPNCFTDIICNIPLLSQCITSRVTPGMIKLSTELQEMLYHMIPLIQRYLFSKHQEEHKELEIHHGIVEYLQRLKCFTTIELKCRYVIELDGKELVSEESTVKGCWLEDEPATPAVYVVTSTSGKITDKGSLVDQVLIKLFFRKVADKTNARSFLTDLVMNDPKSEEEKTEIAERFNLPDLPQESNHWNVIAPETVASKPPKAVEKDEDADITEENQMEEESPDDGCLKAWPPRAPVRDPNTQKAGKRREGTFSPSQEHQPPSEDVITLKDVQALREAQTQRKDNIQHKQEDGGEYEQAQGQQPYHTNREREQMHFPTAQNNEQLQPRQGKPEQLEEPETVPPSEKETDQDDRSVASRSIPAGSATAERRQQKFQWTPRTAPDFTNAESMDLTELMESVPIDDNTVTEALVPGEGGQASREAVGRWGEWFIYDLLKKSSVLPNGLKIVNVNWLNKDRESGNPYDLVVEAEGEHQFFIEVKATASLNKELIPISWKELKFAELQQQNYLLYRLYNVGKSPGEMQLKYLQNLCSHIETHPAARLFLTL